MGLGFGIVVLGLVPLLQNTLELGLGVPRIHIGGQLGIRRRAHQAAHSALVGGEELVCIELLARDAPALGGAVLGKLGQGDLVVVDGLVAQLHLNGNGNGHVILTVNGGQGLEDLLFEISPDLPLQLELQRGAGRRRAHAGGLAGVVVALGILKADGLHLQPRHAVGHVVADGIGLRVGQGLAPLHGENHTGAGLHHVVTVQHIAPVLAHVDVYRGAAHLGELADGLLHPALQLHQPGPVPIRLGGQGADLLEVAGGGCVGLGVLVHQQPGLQAGRLALRHQYGSCAFHAVIGDPLLLEPAEHRPGLLVGRAGDQGGIGPGIQENDDANGQGGHRDTDNNPYFFGNLSQGRFYLFKIALQLFLVQALSTPLCAYFTLAGP